MARITDTPGANLGIFAAPPDFSFNIAFEDPDSTIVAYKAYINLPGMNRYIPFQSSVYQRIPGAPNGNITVSLMNIIVDVSGWNGGDPLYVDDPNTPEIEGHAEPISANLWKWLQEDTTYSIVVRLTAEDREYTVTTDSATGHLQIGQIHARGDKEAEFTFTKTGTIPTHNVVVTTIGRQKIAQRILSGQKVVLDQAAIDDGNGLPYMPDKNMTQLYHEVWRGGIAEAKVEGNIIRLLTVLGSSIGNFTCRAIGFFDEDNDLIIVANMPETEKVSSFTGIDYKLRILVNVIVADASAVAINVIPVLNTVDHEELDNTVQELTITITNMIDSKIDQHNKAANRHTAQFAATLESAAATADSKINTHNTTTGRHTQDFANALTEAANTAQGKVDDHNVNLNSHTDIRQMIASLSFISAPYWWSNTGGSNYTCCFIIGPLLVGFGSFQATASDADPTLQLGYSGGNVANLAAAVSLAEDEKNASSTLQYSAVGNTGTSPSIKIYTSSVATHSFNVLFMGVVQ